MRGLLVAGTLVVAALAGTIVAGDAILSPLEGLADVTRTAGNSLAAGAPLWADPQNTPHPAYGWPTISSPPADPPPWWQPIPASPLPATVTGMEHEARAAGVFKGAGMAAFGGIAVVPGFGSPTKIVDIRDPTTPVAIASFSPQQGTHRGAAIIAYPDGRLVTVISTDSVIDVWDITDPTSPQPLPVLHPSGGSHKVGVVPGTPIVYNAASNGGGTGGQIGNGNGVTEIFDLSDPWFPIHVKDWRNGYSCHHVYFWNDPSADKYRAVCAGKQHTQIWDTADPLAPQVIVSLPFGSGVVGAPSTAASSAAFSHYAGLSQDGTVLLVGDENGGGGLPPGCVAEARTPLASASTPVGAVWFYDVTDEQDPTLLGWYSALNDPLVKSPLGSCTAHHGRLVPTPGQDTLAMSFYGAGVILVDFTDPKLPRAIDQYADGSNTWETWYYNGYLMTGDLSRGMDVLRIV